MHDTDELIIGSVKAAEIVGISRSQLNRLAAAGKIPAEKIMDAVWLFKVGDVKDYAQQRKESV